MRNNEKACTLRVDATSRFVFFHSLSCHCTRPSSRSQATNCQNFSSRTDANFFLTRDIITDGHGYVKIKLLTRDCRFKDPAEKDRSSKKYVFVKKSAIDRRPGCQRVGEGQFYPRAG